MRGSIGNLLRGSGHLMVIIDCICPCCDKAGEADTRVKVEVVNPRGKTIGRGREPENRDRTVVADDLAVVVDSLSRTTATLQMEFVHSCRKTECRGGEPEKCIPDIGGQIGHPNGLSIVVDCKCRGSWTSERAEIAVGVGSLRLSRSVD